MSTSSTGSATAGAGSEYAGEAPTHADHEAHQHTHPSDRNYYVVALILAVLTAVEVGTYFVEDLSTTALVAFLSSPESDYVTGQLVEIHGGLEIIKVA